MSDHTSEASMSDAMLAAVEAGEYTTPKVIAHACGVSDKQFRNYLRASVKRAGGTVGQDTPGRGKQYAIPSRHFDKHVEAFRAWQQGGGGYMLVSLFDDETAADVLASDEGNA